MRIALVGPAHPYKGGIVHHTTELAHRLTERGHEVRIESWSQQYPERLYPGQQRIDEPEIEPHPGTRHGLSWRRPDSWWRVGRRLRHEVDAVVIVLVNPVQVPAYLVLLSALGRRVASVALCHNVLPHEPNRLDRPLVAALLRRVGAVLVHSDRERTVAESLTPMPVRVATMAPHLPGQLPAVLPNPDRPATRRLLFFGLVRAYKGLDVLLRALPTLPHDVQLIVAGEMWAGEESYRSLADELGVASRVDWRPGYVPARELPGLLAEVDALVLPYRSATASQNVELAAAHGLPVVVTRTGALALAVQSGIGGLVIEPGDVHALAAALHELYEPGRLPGLRRGVLESNSSAATADAWDRYLSVLGSALNAAGDAAGPRA